MRIMIRRKRWLLVAVVLLVAMLTPGSDSGAAPAAQDRTAAFEPAPCMFEAFGLIEGQDVECGYVTVPERHSNPDGPTIRLAVAILKSRDPNPAPDPLFLAQGGPGGSTIDTYTQLLPTAQFPGNRDIVLFDQRGTLYSQPALVCDEFFDLIIETIDQDLTDEEALRLSQEAMLACRDRLVSEGIDLSAYNSLENAADIEALRVALGYDQINLYGVSYGSLLALHTMRDHPEGLRSVILDAVVPPQINFIVESPQSQDRAFTLFFEACADDPACNAAFPDLESVFYGLVDQLNANPVRAPMTDPETGITYDGLIDGDTLQSALFQLLYASDVIPILPKVIDDVRDGSYAVLGRLLGLFIFDRSISYGMYYSILCAEDADFTLEDLPLEGVRPWIAEDARQDAVELLSLCAQWGVEPLEPFVDAPVSSDIPTLVLSGAFDPITPPAFGEVAAQTLAQSYVYTFPTSGHGAAFQGECPDQIIAAFLDDPAVEPDATCVNDLRAPDFLTPADVIDVPALLPLLNLEGSATPELIVFGLCLLVLLSVVIVWPLAWIIRLLRGRPGESLPLLGRLIPWLAALNGMLILAFVGAVFAVVIALALQNNNAVLFGLPREWAGLFVLPIVSLILTLLMLAGSAQSWVMRYWSIWKRGYFTLLTLAALGCMLLLVNWGMLGVLLG